MNHTANIFKKKLRSISKFFQIAIIAVVVLGASAAFAQFLDQGGITGIVQDPSGAVISGAQVTLTDTDTGLVLHATTNTSGAYGFSPIKIGHYKIDVSAAGFQGATQENLTLNIGATLSIPFKLTAGSTTQSVTVTAAPPLLQTQEGSVGQVITTQQINNTPLNGRNWVFMVQLSPGAVPAGSRAKGTGDFNANGLRAEQNDFVLDGMDNLAVSDDFLGGTSFLVNPPPDALQEFKVSTANYSAEFGHSAGAVVDASIKSGTNQIHGDVWEYWRNNILEARDFTALTIPEFRQNLFGASLGTPILKDHLFFFGDVQANRIAAQQPFTQSVPTLLERQGNFTELLNPALTGSSKPIKLYEPNSGGTQPLVCNGQQNVFCPNQIDSVAQNVLNLYPLPNANGGKTFSNNVQNLSQPQNTFQYDVRVDWNITAKDQAFVRFSDNNQIGNYAGSLGPILDGSGGNGSQNVSGKQVWFGNSFVFSETHIFNPTLVNEFRFGYDYGHFDIFQLNPNTDIASTLGLGGMPFAGLISNGGLPTLGITGLAQAGAHQYRPEQEKENEYQILDNVSKTLGTHSLKLGISVQSVRAYTLEPPASHGYYDFTGFFTGANGAAFTGNGTADFLADQMHDGDISPSSPYNDVHWYIAGYAQDDWRATDKLTLNLGLRYDWFQPYREMANRQASFVPTGPPGISTGSGTYTFPIQDQGNLNLSPTFLANLAANNIALQYSSNRALTNERALNFGPRFGFAYQVDPTSVVRGGFGMFYQGQQFSGVADNLATNYPFSFTSNFVTPTCNPKAPPCLADGYNLETGFGPALNQGLASLASNPSLIGQSANLKTTYAMDYNLTVQKAFTDNLVGSLGYVGTLSRHLPVGLNPNASVVLVGPGVSTQPLLPFPKFGAFTDLDYVGISSYHSLQTKLEKRFSSGLEFLATYVWGHAMDDAADPLSTSIGYRNTNIIPIRDEYTNSGWDTRQRFTLNGYYQIPYGSGTAHPIHSRVVDAVLGGWATNLTFQVQTGQPFTVSVSNITTAGGGTANAIRARDPFIGGGTPDPTNPSLTCPAKVRTLQHWYNPCAFKNPLPAQGITTPVTGIAAAEAYLGGRSNTVYGPGYNRLDMSLFKSFPTFHSQYLQIRVDAFNLANTPEWANPSTANDSQTGGLITSARAGQVYTPDARNFQLSGKYVF